MMARIMARRASYRAQILPGRGIARPFKSGLFWLLIICVVAAGAIFYFRLAPAYGLRSGGHGDTILFTGDIMLARGVETLMETEGLDYPFKGIRDMLAEHEAVVGNFEASIPKQHWHTPGYSMTFSVLPEAATALSRVGFTHLTLANNHAYDYGKDGYASTRAALNENGIMVAGDPYSISEDDVLYTDIGDVRIAIIPINTVFGMPETKKMQDVLHAAEAASDVQIVSIHWGEEYRPRANETQRLLAYALIDAGADAIVGAHPHVVQDIEEYRGAPIFYSLGNFIFDQYWEDAVQEGITVAMSFADGKAEYELIPITSVEQKSAPRPMNRVERTRFLDALAEKSEEKIADAIRDGAIVELYSKKTE
jgi:poly-gamma-glutamate synthesis protein (capsule biosynthesis protein)